MKMRRRVSVSHHLEGMLLSSDVYASISNKKVLLIRKNNILTDSIISKMFKHDIRLVSIWMTDKEYEILKEAQ